MDKNTTTVSTMEEKIRLDCTKRMDSFKTRLENVKKSPKTMVLPKPIKFVHYGNYRKTYVAFSWPAMTFGKHKWIIEFSDKKEYDYLPSSFFVGLTTVSDYLENEQKYDTNNGVIGGKFQGWGYSSYGNLHNGKLQKQGLPRFRNGDSVTLVLDLGTETQNKQTKDGSSNGSLYARVNDGEQHLLFSNLLSIGESNGGFFPVVSLEDRLSEAYLHNYKCLSEERSSW